MNTAARITMVLVLVASLGCKGGNARGGSVSREGAAPAVGATMEANCSAAPVADHTPKHYDGPTIRLSYSAERSEKNPTHSFMYFVPLISPVGVDRKISAGNEQRVGIISYEKKVASRSFYVSCDFEMSGKGCSRYIFDPAEMVARRLVETKKPKGTPLSNLLDYINFEGEGFGRVRIKGTIDGPTETVTEVELRFDARGCKSPATIGLYDLKPRDGQYWYVDRSNEVVAQVNSLTFKRSNDPRMSITVACVSDKEGSNGFFAQIKAAIANLFIKPVRIDPLGNETMLRFGYALAEQRPVFTFPKAGKLKETSMVAAGPERK